MSEGFAEQEPWKTQVHDDSAPPNEVYGVGVSSLTFSDLNHSNGEFNSGIFLSVKFWSDDDNQVIVGGNPICSLGGFLPFLIPF